ncbi:hypothetical protein F5Y11DRAFT_351558 [Daldinia sp. FL1419]|nr:hypothetical protein F5Y11DRAFT_351558 [Daldinia sp. FL1419]
MAVDEKRASDAMQAYKSNKLSHAGLPSPMAILIAEEYHSGTPIFNEDSRSERWVWVKSSGDNKVRGNQSFLEDAEDSPTSTITTTDSESTVFHKEHQERIQCWLKVASGSTPDPEPIGPFTDLTSPANSSGLPTIKLRHKSKFSDLSGSYSNSDIIQKVLYDLSSPLPIAQSEPKPEPIRFQLLKMYSTPQRGRSAAEVDLTAIRARALSKEPFYSRSGSRSRQDEPCDILPYSIHSRGNSVSSNTRQQSSIIASPERGRSLRGRYEFQPNESDDLSPVPENAGNNFTGHIASQITTVADFMNARDEEPPRKSRDMSRHKFPAKPAEATPTKPEKRRPEQIDLAAVHRYGAIAAKYMNMEAVHNPISSSEEEQTFGDSPSVYGASASLKYYEEPQGDPYNAGMGRGSILKGYSDWMEKQPTDGQTGKLNQQTTTTPKNSASEDSSHDFPLQRAGLALPKSQTKPQITNEITNEIAKVVTREPGAPPFTPLTPWVTNGNSTKVKKNLFGNKGWLEDTAAEKKPERVKSMNSGFLGSMKKTAKKIAGMAEFRVGATRVSATRELNITLDPREQSLLYCELEFVLSNALSGYINSQLHLGRLNPHILAKIADAWTQMGRPKVIGFRYDLETQIDMLCEHIDDFRFYGPHYADKDVIKGRLHGMRINARTMRIRTLCQPDSVIAKHILDAQSLIQLLNSPPELQTSLAEVCQFFRTILEVRLENNQNNEEVAKSSAEQTRKYAFKTRSQGDLSPDQSRVKNQIDVPPTQRNFSGPILEPKVYKPSEQPHALTK